MKKISIITPTFNEEENVALLIDAISKVAEEEKKYTFEHIIIDNASTDNTVDKVKDLISQYPHVGLIVNNRNFGQLRSPFHALTLVESDATIQLCSDLQEPPELIHDFLRKWENGALVVGGVKESSEEKDKLRIDVLKLTEEVATLRERVKFLEAENERLKIINK